MTQNVPTPLEPTAAPEPAGDRASPRPVRRPGGAPWPGQSRDPASATVRSTSLLGGALVLAVAGVASRPGADGAGQALTGGNFPGGGAFNGQAGGRQRQRATAAAARAAATAQGGAIFGGGAGPTIEGTVESISDTTLTLKTRRRPDDPDRPRR